MIRILLIIAVVLSGLYAASTVPLGDRTLSQHIRAIRSTPEAQQLVDGAKSRLEPAVKQIKTTVVGEAKKIEGVGTDLKGEFSARKREVEAAVKRELEAARR